MDRTQVKHLKSLIKLMHESGVTQLKVDGIEITIPKPQTSVKRQIMTISPQEIAAASQSAFGNHKHAMDILSKKPTFTDKTELDELDDILFEHEKY